MGLGALLGIVAVMIQRTWRSLHTKDRHGEDQVFWLAAWVIFTSACFGVVLEGPMGAVVFWTILGLANAPRREKEADATPAAVADLRSAAPAIQVSPAP